MTCKQIIYYLQYGRKYNLKNIIGVRFKKPGKIYFFDPDGAKIEKGKLVIVETTMGVEIRRSSYSKQIFAR